jgi:hypothetical protein
MCARAGRQRPSAYSASVPGPADYSPYLTGSRWPASFSKAQRYPASHYEVRGGVLDVVLHARRTAALTRKKHADSWRCVLQQGRALPGQPLRGEDRVLESSSAVPHAR